MRCLVVGVETGKDGKGFFFSAVSSEPTGRFGEDEEEEEHGG